MRFYMGTIWISRRADLMPVYAMIFRRLKAAGADWVYHFPEIGIVELARADDVDKAGAAYSVSQAAVAELEAQKRRAEVERFRAELREANARAREEALDRPPPATVRAYRQVYGRDPRGWPPA
jgi:acyl-CoA reductase-like NAD-dependent aldehyde dehydrogenase